MVICFMNSNPSVPGGRPPVAIGYKSKYRKVLGFVDNEGSGSTEPGFPYLSYFPDMYYIFSVHPVFCSHFLGM